MSNPIAYSIRSAGKAFDPPLSEKLIRRMVRAGCFKTVEIGGNGGGRGRIYLLRDEIVEALRELGSKTP
jgi:hypothetical protein